MPEGIGALGREPKICIICRNVKNNFNKEHIFPESIGGAFFIHSVCEECNKFLGKNIDEPFANYSEISLNRITKKIKRNNRNIKHPFTKKKKFKTEDGAEFVVNLNKDGSFRADFLPKFELEKDGEREVGKFSISSEWLKNDPGLIERVMKKYESITGQPAVETKTEYIRQDKLLSVTLIDSANKVIYGCLKIAYEATVTVIPDYFNDPIASVYSKMLATKTFSPDYASYFNLVGAMVEEIRKLLNQYPGSNIFECAATILSIKDVGLVCAVRVFGIFYPIIMSKSIDYLDDRIIVLLNDSKKEKAWYALVNRPKSFHVEFDRQCMTPRHIDEFSTNGGTTGQVFRNPNGLYPIYDGQGKLLADHADQLIQLTPLTANCPAAIIPFTLLYPVESYFFLSTQSLLLYKIEKLLYFYK